MKLIIQARMTSTRLPKKVMLPLCSKSVLEVMLKRLERFKKHIIIATTNDGSQIPIKELCNRLGIECFEGDSEDVLARYYLAAKHFGADASTTIIRCTSDCPCIDPDIIEKALAFYTSHDAEYVCACQESGFPRGLDTEIFSFSLLEQAYLQATLPYEREHVTPYIKQHAKQAAYHNTQDDSKYRLTLDETDDYKALCALFEKLSCRLDFNYEELIDTLEQNPSIYEMNKHVTQKKDTH